MPTALRIQAPPDGAYPGIPMEEYLRWDAWSKSDLAEMLKSPEECRWAFYEKPIDGPSSAAQSFGTLAHTAVLEPHRWPPENVAWIPGPYNRNPGAAASKDAKARGLVPLDPEVRTRVERLAGRLRGHPKLAALLELSDFEREIAAVWTDPVTGLRLKARADLKVESIQTIGDLKTTTQGTHPEAFSRQMWSFNYHLGAPHYLEVFSGATGMYFDTFVWMVVAQTDPFTPRAYVADPMTLEAGRDLGHYLRRRVAACIESGDWPAASEVVEPVRLQDYRLKQIVNLLEEEAEKA